MRIPTRILIAASALLCSLAPPAAVADDYTYVTDQHYRGSRGNQSFGIAAGALVCESKPPIRLRPIAWFCAAKPNDGKSQFLCLIIFKTPAGFEAGSIEGSFDHKGSSNTGAEGKGVLQFGKKKVVEFAYKFALD